MATRSPDSPAPLWAVEGLAEWVALRGRPGGTSFGSGRPAGGGPAGRAAAAPCPVTRHFAAGRGGLNRRVRRGLAGLPLRRRDLLGLRPRPALRRARPRPARWTRRAARCWASMPRRSPRAGSASSSGRPEAVADRADDTGRDQRLPAPDRRHRVLRQRRLHRCWTTTSWSTRPGRRRRPPTDGDRGFPVVRAGSLLLPTPATAERAAALVRRHRITRVVFGAAAPLGLLAPALRAAGARRIVGLTHGHETWWASVPGARALLRRIGEGCDHLTVVSAFTERRISRRAQPGRTGPPAAAPAPGRRRPVPAGSASRRGGAATRGRGRPVRRPEGLRHPAAGLAAGRRPDARLDGRRRAGPGRRRTRAGAAGTAGRRARAR